MNTPTENANERQTKPCMVIMGLRITSTEATVCPLKWAEIYSREKMGEEVGRIEFLSAGMSPLLVVIPS